MGRDELRAGDGDREAVAGKLKTALDEGRLDLHEYDERLQRTYAAKTYGDLNGLLADLPGAMPAQRSQVQGYEPPTPSGVPAAGAPAQRSGEARMSRWLGPYAGLFLVATVIWAITCVSSGHLNYYWPVWLLIPLIFGVFGHWRGHSSGDSRYRERDVRRAARRERRGR